MSLNDMIKGMMGARDPMPEWDILEECRQLGERLYCTELSDKGKQLQKEADIQYIHEVCACEQLNSQLYIDHYNQYAQGGEN